MNPTHIVALSSISHRYLFPKLTIPPLNHVLRAFDDAASLCRCSATIRGLPWEAELLDYLQISQLMVPSLWRLSLLRTRCGL